MDNNLTELVLVIDNSGSMASIQKDIEGSLEKFINEQKEAPGKLNVTYYTFSDKVASHYHNRSIESVSFKLEPNGMTALFDGIGIAAKAVGERLAQTDEDKRPGKVLFVVVTDGGENASKIYNRQNIITIVSEQTHIYKWSFLFIGSNQDAVLTGGSYGFNSGSSLTFANNSQSITGAFDIFNTVCSGYRFATLSGEADNYNYSFSEQDRAAAFQV